MRRSGVGLEEVAHWDNLASAFRRAAQGKAHQVPVQRFRAQLFDELAGLRRDILDGSVAVGRMRSFRIRDPKPRIIHAPCFRERVLHHALMAHAGPVLDRSLVDDTFACRVGKGTLAAVYRVRHHLQRHPWYAKIDIKGYFPSIDHGVLQNLLERRFKNQGLLQLMGRIIAAHHTDPGKGLPIGALTSQHFANYYLNGVDRLLLEGCRVRGLVRYMDDLVWWGDSLAQVREALARVRLLAEGSLGLVIKNPVYVGRSRNGFTFCGYRILPDRLLLSRRGKKRYGQLRQRWEQAWCTGTVDLLELQQGFSSVLVTTLHADAAPWRREQLRRHPLAPLLSDI
ncbi:MAG: RNA-directed DNA polymerase [Magnetococcales bacterium]|nr:RNA-directed DNA polymerase [Magnetococcales bacterium]